MRAGILEAVAPSPVFGEFQQPGVREGEALAYLRAEAVKQLEQLTAASGVKAAVPGVRALEPKWRARNDSNVRPSDS